MIKIKYYVTKKTKFYCTNFFLNLDLFHFRLIEGSLSF